MRLFTALATVTLSFGLAGTLIAQERRPPRPPPQAIEACADLSDGDACAFESPRGAVEGVCWRPEASVPLACRPHDAPERPDRG